MQQPTPIPLPARGNIINSIVLKFNKKNIYEYNLKYVIRNIAKRFPEYFAPIEIEPLVYGMTDSGEKIEINTLGRWIFGVPGFAGNVVFEGGEELITFRLPKESPEIAINLLTKCVGELDE